MGVFEPVDTTYDFPALEEKVLAFWKRERIFEQSLEQGRTRGGQRFVFYEGPPTANGMPHNGHVLTRAIKDLFPRYRTMCGDYVPRKAGWDTHGLPVEIEVEKELGIRGREAILEYGVEPFTRRCIENVFRYTSEWERLTERIAFWIDLPQAYVTYHTPYIESVWWALSRLFAKGLLYRGHKVVWWWTKGGTALSAGEVGEGYKKVNDPAATVRFPAEKDGLVFLAWTTTPWTLPSNLGLAVGADIAYALVELEEEPGRRYVVAAESVERLFGKRAHRVVEQRRGAELVGLRYTPPYAFEKPASGDPWRVVAGDFVTTGTGTGIVHIAPGFGEDDYRTAKEADLGFVQHLTPSGVFPPVAEPFAGLGFKEADPQILKDLEQRGLLFAKEIIAHDYPFCPRADKDPLIQYARESWFIRTRQFKEELVANNRAIEWFPEHIKEGRFGDFLANNVDWALSRERFWGTPLNIWVNDETGAMDCPTSVAEILQRNPRAFDKFEAARAADPALNEHLKVHKPWIDEITWTKPGERGTYRRVPEVIDCWFDSGCVPFAQFGFPHSGVEAFREAFPADFISEAVDQTRGWFYSMLAVSTLVFDRETRERYGLRGESYPHPYKRCIVLGHVCDRDGIKESKSKKNYTPPSVILSAVRMPMTIVVAGDARFQELLAKKAPQRGQLGLTRDDLEGLDLQRKDCRVQLELGGKVLRELQPLDLDKAERWVAAGGGNDHRHIAVLSSEQAAELGAKSGDVATFVDPTPAPGGDAFRWFFYASNPPWNNTRHSLAGVRQAQKDFLITLQNVYSFFVIYANIDGYDPARRSALEPLAERGEMDRWILSELHLTVRDVRAHMDGWRLYEAAQRLGRFVDSLSNWYVRRSRARFWSEGQSADKLAAFDTLHTCLATFARAIAPFTPFFAEELHQNLVVRPLGARAPSSVHLSSYPEVDARFIDEGLSRRMAAAREIVSLGLSVRSDARLKVRQPLRSARVAVADAELRAALAGLCGVIADELNVKLVDLVADASTWVSYTCKPNFKALGPKVGKLMPLVKDAVMKADPARLREELTRRGACEILVASGERVELTPAEIEVALEAKPGFAAASGTQAVVLLETEVDEALIAEMLARELVNRIQAVRKDLRLDYVARIEVALTASEKLAAAIAAHRELIAAETLSRRLDVVADPGAGAREVAIEGETIRLAVSIAT
ncbi:MAG: isoleucine--tRNA ligase [Planctomycetes bacterium]|nr:isoleucine--tRNA ligase [Planctomycetota bacterium]